MMRTSGIRLAIGVAAMCLALPAAAQDNLDRGKSGAQLYASDCAVCHKSPQGLAKSGGFFGVEGFLREHYTASRESAATIAAYLRSVEAPPAPARRQPSKRTAKGDSKGEAKGDGKAKPAAVEKRPDAAQPDVIKLDDPPAAKPAEAKPAAAVAEPKPAEPKPAEVKPAEAKPSEPPGEPKPATAPKSE